MKIYMIRNRANGRFSNGKVTPWFETIGKIWNKKSAVEGHLRRIDQDYLRLTKMNPGVNRNHPYTGCDVIEYNLTVGEVKELAFNDFRPTTRTSRYA